MVSDVLVMRNKLLSESHWPAIVGSSSNMAATLDVITLSSTLYKADRKKTLVMLLPTYKAVSYMIICNWNDYISKIVDGQKVGMNHQQ